MTRGSIREYTEAIRGRYLRASKKEKGRILEGPRGSFDAPGEQLGQGSLWRRGLVLSPWVSPILLMAAGRPLGARILVVADAYDAITSARPYHPAMTSEQAMKILKERAGIQWDLRWWRPSSAPLASHYLM